MTAIFGKQKIRPTESADPDAEFRELQRRLAGRGGQQSTILTTGRGLLTQPNIFSRNLGGQE